MHSIDKGFSLKCLLILRVPYSNYAIGLVVKDFGSFASIGCVDSNKAGISIYKNIAIARSMRYPVLRPGFSVFKRKVHLDFYARIDVLDSVSPVLNHLEFLLGFNNTRSCHFCFSEDGRMSLLFSENSFFVLTFRFFAL